MSQRNVRDARRWPRVALLACAVVAGLSACTPQGRMDGVAAEQAKAVRRSDRFQAVARGDQRLVAVGAFGVVAVSADDGATWTRQELAGAPALLDVAVCGDGSFAALDFAGKLWRGDARAESWKAFDIPAKDTVLGLACTPDNRLWVVGAQGGRLVSGDGGASWQDTSLDEDLQLLNVEFASAGDGMITGEFGRVLVTHDGGATWVEGGDLGPDFYPQAMHFPGAGRAVVVGLGGAVLTSDDGGENWKRGKAPTEAPLYGVLALPEATVVVGAAGQAFRQSDGGWAPLGRLPMTDLRGMASTPSGIVLAGSGVLAAVSLDSSAHAQRQ